MNNSSNNMNKIKKKQMNLLKKTNSYNIVLEKIISIGALEMY